MSSNINTMSNYQQFQQGFSVYVAKTILHMLMAENIVITLAFKIPFEMGSGNRVMLTRPSQVPPTLNTIRNGNGGSGMTTSEEIYTGLLEQSSTYMTVATDVVKFFNSNSGENWALKTAQQTQQMQQSMSNGLEQKVITTWLNSMSQKVYGTGGTPTLPASGTLQETDIKAAANLLITNLVRPVVNPVQPSRNISTNGISEAFIIVAPVPTVNEIVGMASFTPVFKYGNGQNDRLCYSEKGSVVSVQSCRILQSVLPAFNQATSNNEYSSLIWGQEAFGLATSNGSINQMKKGDPAPLDVEEMLQDAFGINLSVTTLKFDSASLADPSYAIGELYSCVLFHSALSLGVQCSASIINI